MREFAYFRTAAAVPIVQTGDCQSNTNAIIELCQEAFEQQVGAVVFPELSVTGYTCADLFYQKTLLKNAEKGVAAICDWSQNVEMLLVIGVPIFASGALYNCAVVINQGEILGIIPKTYLPNSHEYYERRWFAPADKANFEMLFYAEQEVPFGTNNLFVDVDATDVVIGVEICEDLWAPIPPSSFHALGGATIILNPSASNDIIAKGDYREALVRQQSARTNAAYVYASCGYGESTTDVVFGGDTLICEKGRVLSRGERFQLEKSLTIADIDIDMLNHDRMMQTSFADSGDLLKGMEVPYSYTTFKTMDADNVLRTIDPQPFVPSNVKDREKRCKEIFDIQVMGLGSRVRHIGEPNLVVGISGGLDSTLALLVCVSVCDKFKMDRSKIHAVTMPGFGTTDRTYDNAVQLIKRLGATFHEISIKEAATNHLKDLGHALDCHDVTYENAQARERTQILMDLSNQVNGIVVGTGDLSELALGWATYNGDHMSMYGVNGSVPKTLVRYLVQYVADIGDDQDIKAILYDVLDTPVSPELLPPDASGKIAQKTEDLVGPYELHDFFLYQVLRNGFEPEKIFAIACQAFKAQYEIGTIKKWLANFYRRFFAQQFKRSCLPDGPKVGSISLSPRGDLRMPSDAKMRAWMKRVDTIQL